MATSSGRSGGSRPNQPRTLLERILRSSTSAEMVGAMIHNGIAIPEVRYGGSTLRLLLSRAIKMPLDDESRNLIGEYLMHWIDAANPNRVTVEASIEAEVATRTLELIQSLNDHISTVKRTATATTKKQVAEQKLDEMIGRTPGRPTSDTNAVLDTVLGQGSGGGGNDLISMLLVLNELGESSPFPVHIGPRRTEPIERRREWAEGAAKVVAGIAIFVVLVVTFMVGAKTNWMLGVALGLTLIVGMVWSVISAVKAGSGWLMKKAFPQFDEDGFRKKVITQCETTLAYLGLTKAEVVAMSLEHKFLEEIDGELRKEGLVYNRFDEQIDDWVKDYLGLATARPVTPKLNPVDRFMDFFNQHV